MKVFIKRIILWGLVLCFWSIASSHFNPLFVPSPKEVFNDLLLLINNGEIFLAIRYSFVRVTIAAILSSAVAIPVALLVFNVKIANDLLNPIISVMRYIPVTAFYPLLIMWFGIDEWMKIVFLFVATFVYMMPSVILCLDEINQDLIDTGLTIGMSKWQTIWRIQIPSTLPSIINSFIMMYGIGFMKSLLGHPYVGQTIGVYKSNMIIPQLAWADKDNNYNPSREYLDIPETCPVFLNSVKKSKINFQRKRFGYILDINMNH